MIWRRLKRLWEISGINVDGFEIESQRKQIINKVVDVLAPSKEESIKNLDKYNARFIPRVTQKPIDKINSIANEV